MEELIKEYVKENNIVSYLSYSLDSENIKNKISQADFKDKDFKDEDYIDTLISQEIDLYNYNLAVENEDINKIIEYIQEVDFNIMINEDLTIDLEDIQGGYLGGKDSYEDFTDIMSANARIDHFYDDWFFSEY